MSPRPTARKAAEQAHVTALVDEIGADTATIARHSATFGTGSASLTEAQGRVGHSVASLATARSRDGLRNRVQRPLNPG